MKYYSNEQINYLKQIISDEMFHMGKIEIFEQVQDNEFLLKVTVNKCAYMCSIEYDHELFSCIIVIKSSFGRVVLRRNLSDSFFSILFVESNINKEIVSPLKSACEMIEEQIKKAKGSKGYFPHEAFYEAKGMLDMAYHLETITKEEFFDFNTKIVRDGINNPEYFN